MAILTLSNSWKQKQVKLCFEINTEQYCEEYTKKSIGQINVQNWQRSEGNPRSNNGLSIQLHRDSNNIYKYLQISCVLSTGDSLLQS
jgi:hypothetical protein